MARTTRRAVLFKLGALAASPLMLQVLPPFFRTAGNDTPGTDEEIFEKKIEWAKSTNLAEKPLGEIIGTVGRSFLGTPYIAHSLELPGEERLIVNLRAFDCLTFVESTLAISRCIRANRTSFGDFKSELQQMRYRNGIIDGYPSRLHYFSEWIRENDRNKIVKDVTADLGGTEYRKPLNFMSTHRSAYAQLEDENVLRRIQAVEAEISVHPLHMIARNSIDNVEHGIRSGDIVALATSKEGIDVSHSGLTLESEGEVRYLHAPLSGGTVQLSPGSLSEYVQHGMKSLTGIMVVRPLEPNAGR
jgi:hypothetical protein